MLAFVRTERVAFALLLAWALGCSDGIGRPIVSEEPAPSSAGAPGGFGGGGNGGRGGLPDFGGRFSGWGGWDGRREPPPEGSCEDIDQWPDESRAAEIAVLEFLNFGRASGFSCTNGSDSVTAPYLVMQPELQCAARRHSRDMVERQFFDHVNPDLETAEDRIRKTGYPFGVVGETIARASGSPEATPYQVLADLGAEGGGECEPLVDPRFDSVGIGRFYDYWTLDFAGPIER